jgi:hypothetical protein
VSDKPIADAGGGAARRAAMNARCADCGRERNGSDIEGRDDTARRRTGHSRPQRAKSLRDHEIEGRRDRRQH